MLLVALQDLGVSQDTGPLFWVGFNGKLEEAAMLGVTT